MNEPKARDYSETLFLPKTDFPMRAGLPQKEPEILARWRKLDLYGRLRSAGQQHGPAFQGIVGIRVDAEGTASAEVRFLQVQLDVLHDSYEESGLKRLLAQLVGVEMGGDRRSKQLNARLTDHFAARAMERSRLRGQSVEIGDRHV